MPTPRQLMPWLSSRCGEKVRQSLFAQGSHTSLSPTEFLPLWEGILGTWGEHFPKTHSPWAPLGDEQVCGREEVLWLNGCEDDPVHRFVSHPHPPPAQDPEETGPVGWGFLLG